MKTLRKLSNRKLDELQARLTKKYWSNLDTAPFEPNHTKVRAADKMLTRIGSERLRRIGL
jgi:hypothetical protein